MAPSSASLPIRFWTLGWSSLTRDWRAGELRLLMLAVTLAVAALTAVGFFADRLSNGLERNARQLLGGDAVVRSDRPAPPEFAAKAADVIGLYLNPPHNALVLSVDEKPSIQALERARGYVQTSSGKIVQGMKSTYKRHGTVSLLAGIDLVTGKVHALVEDRHRSREFIAFLKLIDARGDFRQMLEAVDVTECKVLLVLCNNL